MKKMNQARFQNRLKLHRETVRSLTEPDLQNVAGGLYPTEMFTIEWPPPTMVCRRQ
jgi:hypothetical protein